ncbi:hypothetical protein L1987_36710 [Smallanthus sonchifolius]|uniref:Uncharacterized protein n=1 Tax=Smallanthus sonchifolius TaxID=185202 RepID=A0ACB9HEC3_9ASTR|nr:hypothetical protein L1987_36710 [Smallanthus sonchifolius]
MDSHSHPSPVYRPGGESDREESSESPVYQPTSYPTARARIDLNSNWTRDPGSGFGASGPSPPGNHYQAPHLHRRFSTPPRDPYLAPDPTPRTRMRKLGFSPRTGRAHLLSAHRAGPAHLLSAQEGKSAHLLSTQEAVSAHLLSAQASGLIK